MMTPPLRRFVLTAHITCSVGWFGAVAAFLALAVAELVSQGPLMARAMGVAMALIGWFVIVPLSLASLLTGLVQALGSLGEEAGAGSVAITLSVYKPRAPTPYGVRKGRARAA